MADITCNVSSSLSSNGTGSQHTTDAEHRNKGRDAIDRMVADLDVRKCRTSVPPRPDAVATFKRLFVAPDGVPFDNIAYADVSLQGNPLTPLLFCTFTSRYSDDYVSIAFPGSDLVSVATHLDNSTNPVEKRIFLIADRDELKACNDMISGWLAAKN